MIREQIPSNNVYETPSFIEFTLNYNEKRPHDSLRNLTPLEVMKCYTRNSTFKLSTRQGSLRIHPRNTFLPHQ